MTSPPPDPQSPPTTAPQATARRLIARELGGEVRVDTSDAGAVAAAGERLIAGLTEGLSRSFGPYGALALVSRALGRAQSSRPMLSTVTVTTGTVASSTGALDRSGLMAGLAASARAAGGAAALEGVTVWLTELADLLGGLIGDELAAALLEQSALSSEDSPAPRGGTFVAGPKASDANRLPGTDHDTPSTVNEP